MTLEDVIESLNKYIDTKRESAVFNPCHLILQRVIETCTTFKAYKKYTLILWVVCNNEKYRLLTLNYQYNSKEFDTDDKFSHLVRNLESRFMVDLFNLIIDKPVLDDLIYGKYGN